MVGHHPSTDPTHAISCKAHGTPSEACHFYHILEDHLDNLLAAAEVLYLFHSPVLAGMVEDLDYLEALLGTEEMNAHFSHK